MTAMTTRIVNLQKAPHLQIGGPHRWSNCENGHSSNSKGIRLGRGQALFRQLPCIWRSTGRTIYRHQDLRHSETWRRFAI
jgi:hypothetical protein